MRRGIALGIDFGHTLAVPVRAPRDCLAEALASAGFEVAMEVIAATEPDVGAVRADLAAARDGNAWSSCLRTWYLDWATACRVPVTKATAAAAHAVAGHQSTSNWRARTGADELLAVCVQLDVPVGILSTWGPNLDELVDALGWRDLVATVIASSRAGVAKPDPVAFELLCANLNRDPADVRYAGDDPTTDYDGALAAGLPAVLVTGEAAPARLAVRSLYELADLLLIETCGSDRNWRRAVECVSHERQRAKNPSS